MDKDDKKTGDYFREWISREIDWKDVRREKKDFIEEYFEPETSAWAARPAVWAPAAVFLAAFAVFLFLLPRPVEPPKAPVLETPATIKKVHSDIGTPMVYQRHTGDAPVVVVWVFPQAGGI